MEALYTINNAVGAEDNFLKVYSNRVVIHKPTFLSPHGMFGVIKAELAMQGLIKTNSIGIDVPIYRIKRIKIKPATGYILKNGLLTFYVDGEEQYDVNFLNYDKAPHAFKFWGQDNDTARKIYNYVQSHL